MPGHLCLLVKDTFPLDRLKTPPKSPYRSKSNQSSNQSSYLSLGRDCQRNASHGKLHAYHNFGFNSSGLCGYPGPMFRLNSTGTCGYPGPSLRDAPWTTRRMHTLQFKPTNGSVANTAPKIPTIRRPYMQRSEDTY